MRLGSIITSFRGRRNPRRLRVTGCRIHENGALGPLTAQEISMQSGQSHSVKATLNFAADRNDGGRFSNGKPERIRQNLLPVEVDITNMRGMSRKPSLDVEGFAVVKHSSGHADWSNSAW